MHFEEFNFHPRVADGVKAAGYVTPTPIQSEAIPPILAGRDVLGLAQTGTGKTAAFMLPVLNHLIQGGRRHVRALVIAPTRELAEQINEATRSLGVNTQLGSTTIYGGVSMNPQIENLRRGVEIVVACPGRLLDHMGLGYMTAQGYLRVWMGVTFFLGLAFFAGVLLFAYDLFFIKPAVARSERVTTVH